MEEASNGSLRGRPRERCARPSVARSVPRGGGAARRSLRRHLPGRRPHADGGRGPVSARRRGNRIPEQRAVARLLRRGRLRPAQSRSDAERRLYLHDHRGTPAHREPNLVVTSARRNPRRAGVRHTMEANGMPTAERAPTTSGGDPIARLRAHRVTTVADLHAINGEPRRRFLEKHTSYLTPLLESFITAAP